MLRILLICCLFAVPLTVRSAESTESPIGSAVTDFTLDNSYGKPVSLSDFEDEKLVVIAFLGTECPLAKLYGPRLRELQKKFGDDVIVLGINSNTQDSMTELSAFVQRFKINFPMLKDVGNRVADAMGAERTPEVFVLDRQRVVRYHGRIDDQYGVGYSRERSVQSDLAIAIEEMLQDKPVSIPVTEAVGCYIGKVNKRKPTGDITYTKHIAPIFNSHCVSCHREKELGPFTLTSYEDIQGWEDTILEVIDDSRMPPWFANPDHGKFSNDSRLNEDEIALIKTWIANGMPEGNPADLPEPPKFTDGWRIPEPDQVIKMAVKPFNVPAEGVVDYQRFLVDPGWTEDKYVYAAEARPDNRSVVHHIVIYIIEPGARRRNLQKMLAGYAPGSLPINRKQGRAMRVKAGSKLVFEMHYTPNGEEDQTDLSYAGLCFLDKSEVKTEVSGMIVANPRFKIPAGESDHDVYAIAPVTSDQLLLNMTPHMHLRGKSFRYTARYPDGSQKILLDVPRYDFNFQLKYSLDEPVKLPRGTVIECVAVYDNSEENLSNPDPNIDVRWGDQSFEEMMIGFMETIPAR